MRAKAVYVLGFFPRLKANLKGVLHNLKAYRTQTLGSSGFCSETHVFVFRSARSHSRVTIMPSSATKNPTEHEQRRRWKLTWECCNNEHLSAEGTAYNGRQHHPPACGGPSGQDDLLDISVVFQNIPIRGVVGVIFLESPNMGRIPQTLKLSHPAQPSV